MNNYVLVEDIKNILKQFRLWKYLVDDDTCNQWLLLGINKACPFLYYLILKTFWIDTCSILSTSNYDPGKLDNTEH